MVGSLSTTVCTLDRFRGSRTEKSSFGELKLVSISKSLSSYSITVVAAFIRHFLRKSVNISNITKSDAKRDWMDYARISEEISGLAQIASQRSIDFSFPSVHCRFIPSCSTHLTVMWSFIFRSTHFDSTLHFSLCALRFDHQHFLPRITISFHLCPSTYCYLILPSSFGPLLFHSPSFRWLVAIRSSFFPSTRYCFILHLSIDSSYLIS